MAFTSRTRKRVLAIPRAADGSAFQKCDTCGNSVAIALADMHECECRSSQEVKRFKRIRASRIEDLKDKLAGQPRSAFCFFMEEFKILCDIEDPIEIDRSGFEKWKNMCNKEKDFYVRKAIYVNNRYDEALRNKEKYRFPKPVKVKKTKDSGESDSACNYSMDYRWVDDSGDSYPRWLVMRNMAKKS